MQKLMGYFTRLATYASWPVDTSVSCLTLAKSGFEYTGVSDQVTCPLCGLVIKDWSRQNSVKPLDEHRLRSPQCRFFSESSSNLDHQKLSETVHSSSLPSSLHRGSEQSVLNIAAVYRSALERAQRHGVIGNDVPPTGNTATPRDPEAGARARIDRVNPDYGLLKRESARLSTFDDWPASDVVQPSALAGAGFFYTGQADRTCCAFCRGVLRSWQRGDSPDSEHRRHFPDCRFVRRLDVGNVPLERDASLDRQMSALGVNDVSHSACASHDSESNAVSAAGATSSRPTDVAASRLPESVNRRQDSGEHQAAAGNSMEQQTTQTTTKITNDLDDEEQLLMEENRRLHEAKTCKVCMDRDVNTVFLPCGHLVSCDQCSPKLRDCPVCRTYIRGTVRTFLS